MSSLKKPSVLRFKFDDFANLSSHPGKNVYSEKITDCHGNAWDSFIKPGGDVDGEDVLGQDPIVEVYLRNMGKTGIVVRCSFILRDAHGEVFHERIMRQHLFKGGSNWGSGFLERSTILNEANEILVDGALIIDVHLQFKPDPKSLYQPPSSLSDKMLRLLENEDWSDVSFQVGDVVFPAHIGILQMNAPALFDFYLGSNGRSPIPIDGTTPEMFRILLRYAYAEKVPDANTIKESGKEIIDAADRFGVVDLKLLVESAMVECLDIQMDNFADWYSFANAKSCALLKEQVKAYFVSRPVDVLKSGAPDKLKLNEMIDLATSGRLWSGLHPSTSIDEFRESLGGKGMDENGSKEMLVSHLRESLS